MLLLRVAAVLGAVAVVLAGSCTSSTDCCGACAQGERAEFDLSCPTTELPTVDADGPCAAVNSTAASYATVGRVFVDSDGPGVCHVTLTFATGFTYGADVTFTSASGGVCGGPQCKCPDIVTATSGPFAVNNPTSHCVDAGP